MRCGKVELYKTFHMNALDVSYYWVTELHSYLAETRNMNADVIDRGLLTRMEKNIVVIKVFRAV